MKLLLLQDVKNVGKKGEILEVADGYARNFLLPKKLATAATESTVRAKQKEQSDQQAKKARELEAARADARTLETKEVVIKAKVGEGGKFFGSVTSADIAAAVKSQVGREIDKRKIHLPDPIKALGEFRVNVRLYPEVSADLTVKVVSE